MAYSLKFEHPHFPEDKEFSIDFIGMVKNGESIEVSEDQERLFIASNGRTIEDAFKGNASIEVSGSSSLSSDEVKGLLPDVVDNSDSSTDSSSSAGDSQEPVTTPEINEGVNE